MIAEAEAILAAAQAEDDPGGQPAEPPEKGDAEPENGAAETETARPDKFLVVERLKQALRDQNADAFEAQLEEVKTIDAWALAMTHLSDAVQSGNEEIRNAAKAALVDLAENHADKSVANRAVAILASLGDRRPASPGELGQVLSSVGVLFAAIVVGCLLWSASVWLDSRLSDNSFLTQMAQRTLHFTVISLTVVIILVALANGPILLLYAIRSVPEAFRLWLLLTTFGAFGGLLVSMYYERLYLPRRHKNCSLDLGVISDCLFGAAGAVIVFLVVPGAFDLTTDFNVMKVVATAIVGGFAGRALVESVASKTLKDVDALRQERDELKEGAIAIEMLDRQLDPDGEPPDENALKEAITSSSERIRTFVFREARRFQTETFDAGKQQQMLKVKPVYEALIDADKEDVYYRNHAQLGYLAMYREEPEWEKGIEHLTNAIKSRNKAGQEGRFGIYEYCRAVCKIRLGKQVQDIVTDLKTAADDEDARRMLIHDLRRVYGKSEGEVSKIDDTPGKKVHLEQNHAVMKWVEDNRAWDQIGVSPSGLKT
jgi:hypothetical protein